MQINAFNFPVWGFLEKLAPAFIAGVPSIIKPASQTAYLTELVFRRIIESGILPEGSVQLLCGSARDLLDHLDGQDSVAFTGSADTAATLRAHPTVVSSGLRFTAEADSLNCSILGPDVSTSDPEFDLYVKQLVTEMTVKAGQKCTAIRRALVPENLVDDVIRAASERLAAITVGNPADESVRMGALAGIDQRDEVLKSIRALTKSATIVFGDPDSVEVVGADAVSGAFLSPILLHAADKTAPEPHDIEAFGPVSTIIGYSDAADAVALAARGKGSLVASLVTKDAELAGEIVRGLAPFHGRVLVLNSEDARESTGHGSPLPVLVHGGPGRAGGGEELGGIRGVLHHMQRTAVQGTPDVLTATGRRWVTGARRVQGETHPFRKDLGELRIGDTIVGGPRQVTRADIDHFAEFTGDTFYAHMNEEAAKANPFFEGRVAHGYLILSFAAGLFVQPDPGPVLANYGLDNLRFLKPVSPGDSISVRLTVKQKTAARKPEYGEVRWDVEVFNQAGETVAQYDLLTMNARPVPVPAA